MIRLERLIHALPADFEIMRAEARAEKYRMLDTLATDWANGEIRFDRDGEALLAAYADKVLAGIGGLTVEPATPGDFRMRRFYVRIPFRRGGIARRLALMLLDQCAVPTLMITVNAGAGSEPFWVSLGFAPDKRDGRTHLLTGCALAAVRRDSKRGEG